MRRQTISAAIAAVFFALGAPTISGVGDRAAAQAACRFDDSGALCLCRRQGEWRIYPPTACADGRFSGYSDDRYLDERLLDERYDGRGRYAYEDVDYADDAPAFGDDDGLGDRFEREAPAPRGPTAEELRDRAEVAEIQRVLNLIGCNAGAADGVMGPQTRAAIRCVQRETGQIATGVLTAEQRSALLAASGYLRDGSGAVRADLRRRLGAPDPAPAAAAADRPADEPLVATPIPTPAVVVEADPIEADAPELEAAPADTPSTDAAALIEDLPAADVAALIDERDLVDERAPVGALAPLPGASLGAPVERPEASAGALAPPPILDLAPSSPGAPGAADAPQDPEAPETPDAPAGDALAAFPPAPTVSTIPEQPPSPVIEGDDAARDGMTDTDEREEPFIADFARAPDPPVEEDAPQDVAVVETPQTGRDLVELGPSVETGPSTPDSPNRCFSGYGYGDWTYRYEAGVGRLETSSTTQTGAIVDFVIRKDPVSWLIDIRIHDRDYRETIIASAEYLFIQTDQPAAIGFSDVSEFDGDVLRIQVSAASTDAMLASRTLTVAAAASRSSAQDGRLTLVDLVVVNAAGLEEGLACLQ